MKKIILIGILFLAFFSIINFVSGQQETLYCAEKTTGGAWCQNVPLGEVNTNYRYDRTACESTSYCSEGTCVNTKTGECLPSPQAICDPENGGGFYNEEKEEVAQCRIGCCILGDGTSLVERAKCDVLGKDYNVKATFMKNIQNEASCAALAFPQAKGACVFETDEGRDCSQLTRKECFDSEGEFHEGFLCTALELGTRCAKTQRTTCVEGKNEVYFVDSCENIANIYDAEKINDVAYWSYSPGIEGVEINEGDGRGNINSKTNGFCDYLQGSTCGEGNAEYGDYICKDLRCPASDPLTGRKLRQHGEEWCSEPIEKFENPGVGNLSYLLYCYNGEVQYELCDPFRNKLCNQNATTGQAECVVNNWASCIEQNTEEDCLSTDRDCKVVERTSVLKTPYGTEKYFKDTAKSCIPKYPPGFKFWDPAETILISPEQTESPVSICGFASVSCFVHYTSSIGGIYDYEAEPSQECVDLCKKTWGWDESKCKAECTPVCLQRDLNTKDSDSEVQEAWAQSYQNLCTSMGDCGVSANYLNYEGRNNWKDLFKGEKINWRLLPNAFSKK